MMYAGPQITMALTSISLVLLLLLCTAGTRASNFYTKENQPLQINGPRSFQDKIAIIGAGASGIDMARRLKKQGFTRIHIYEKEGRIGGKSMTVKDPSGFIQELGSCCIGPGYENNVMEIISNYTTPDALIPRLFGSVWLDNTDVPITYPEYVMREIMAHFQTNSVEEAMMKLGGLVLRYSQKHYELFGTYEFELMPRPSEATLKVLSCSYMEFLKKNDLDGLRPLLLLTHTLQGYGYLDEIGALYGMMWNTPFLLQSLLALASGQDTEIRPYLLRTGFQNLWEIVAAKEHMQVELNSKVTKIIRGSAGVTIIVNGTSKHYDFLIWSPESKRSLAVFDQPTWKEKIAFESTKTDFLISNLIGLDGGLKAPTPTAYWLDNVVHKRNVSVWASRNSREAFAVGGTDTAGPSGGNIRQRYEVAYQYSTRRPCKPLFKVLKHFKDAQASQVDIVNQQVWRYFPHYSIKDITGGVLWDILEMQGNRRTWFIGSSVSFESLKSVLEYNKLLLSLVKMPARK